MNVTTINKPGKNKKLKEFYQKGKGKKIFRKNNEENSEHRRNHDKNLFEKRKVKIESMEEIVTEICLVTKKKN